MHRTELVLLHSLQLLVEVVQEGIHGCPGQHSQRKISKRHQRVHALSIPEVYVDAMQCLTSLQVQQVETCFRNVEGCYSEAAMWDHLAELLEGAAFNHDLSGLPPDDSILQPEEEPQHAVGQPHTGCDWPLLFHLQYGVPLQQLSHAIII